MDYSPYVKFEQSETSNILLISFGALPGTMGAPAFCFVDVAKHLTTKKLFFVDPHETAYQRGIPGVGSDFWEISRYIKKVQQQEKIRRTIVIGNSAGGFAALVVGSMIGADVIHAFNPPTLLSDASLTRSRQLRSRLQAITGPTRCTYDLGAFLRRELSSSTNAFVYYSRGNAIDRKRSLFLLNIPGIHLIGFPYPEHDLARYLARQGTITHILEASSEGKSKILDSIIRKSQMRAWMEFIPNMTWWVYGKLKNRLELVQQHKLRAKST